MPALIGVGGSYLGFIDRSGRSLRGFRFMKGVIGVVAVVTAVWFASPQRAESAIRWLPLDGTSLEAARGRGRPALIDFVADWCIPCHEMESTTFTDPLIRGEAERFAMFKADITFETEESAVLTNRYEIHGVPTVVFVDSAGDEVHRLVGYVGPEEMLSTMRGVH